MSTEALSEPTVTQRPKDGHETPLGALTPADCDALHDSGAAALAALAVAAPSAAPSANTRARRR